MPTKQESTKKEITKKPTVTKTAGMSVSLFSIDGKETSKLDLPQEIFSAPVNEKLLLQALRIYSNNLQSQHSHTKTRGEVRGTTKKVYKQKGTGNARHGSKKAPIYVGGGIALGPRSRNVTLDLPQKMRQKALISALSKRAADNNIIGLDVAKVTGKTKEIATMLKNLKDLNTKSVLFIDGENNSVIAQGAKNISGSGIKTASNINVFDVISYQTLVITKSAIDKLSERLTKSKEEVSI